jgi:hypothetical protein
MGSGCPPPLLVSHWILQHARNPCQAGSELRLDPMAGLRERRASTPFERRGSRRIQDSSCSDHPLACSFARSETGYSSASEPEPKPAPSRPSSRPRSPGHSSVTLATPWLCGEVQPRVHAEDRRHLALKTAPEAPGPNKRALMRSTLGKERTAPGPKERVLTRSLPWRER